MLILALPCTFVVVPTFRSIVLAPIAGLYRLGIGLRNQLYHRGIFHRTSFTLPVISVGNLSVGGTGKTPHVEYLLRLLSPDYKVSLLSRGYGRKTAGFRWVNRQESAETVGDEPWQIHQKMPHIPIAVGEQRALAIPEMLWDNPNTEVIVLDDAYQHLAVAPGLNILLTTYDHPYWKDHLLPAGWLREPRAAASRADIIVVTKCPANLTGDAQEALREAIQPAAHQSVYFSTYAYGQPYPLWEGDDHSPETVLAVAGIADPDSFFRAVRQHITANLDTLSFRDHHRFTSKDVERICRVFGNLAGHKKVCLTTEKDATRLLQFKDQLQAAQVPVWVLPVEVQLLGEATSFDERVKHFIKHFEA